MAQAIVVEGDCPACQGTGMFLMSVCSVCHGAKTIRYKLTGRYVLSLPCNCDEEDCQKCLQVGG